MLPGRDMEIRRPATVPGIASRDAARLVLIGATAIVFLTLGTRHSFGLFLAPVTAELQIGREVFGLAIAVQNLLWGIGQPIAGAIADRYGSARVVCAGGALYAAGLLIAAFSSDASGLYLGLGLCIGLGLSATTFAVVLGAVGRCFPPERRSMALGIASLGGSTGVFASIPAAMTLIEGHGWATALVGLAGLVGAVCFLSVCLTAVGRRTGNAGDQQSLAAALREASSHRGFVLLTIGFFVCGFQLAFVATHLPAYLVDMSMSPTTGGTALAVIGLANMAGTYACGVLGDRYSKKRLLALLYTVRAASTLAFIWLPLSTESVLVFATVMGLTWLGTVPLTSGIVAQVFGTRYLATLVGVVFMMHQVGSFLGVWLGGYIFDRSGSYDLLWWGSVVLGLAAAAIHLLVDERPLPRPTIAGADMNPALQTARA